MGEIISVVLSLGGKQNVSEVCSRMKKELSEVLPGIFGASPDPQIEVSASSMAMSRYVGEMRIAICINPTSERAEKIDEMSAELENAFKRRRAFPNTHISAMVILAPLSYREFFTG